MRVKVKGRLLSTAHVWFENFADRQALKSAGISGDNIIVHGNECPCVGGGGTLSIHSTP